VSKGRRERGGESQKGIHIIREGTFCPQPSVPTATLVPYVLYIKSPGTPSSANARSGTGVSPSYTQPHQRRSAGQRYSVRWIATSPRQVRKHTSTGTDCTVLGRQQPGTNRPSSSSSGSRSRSRSRSFLPPGDSTTRQPSLFRPLSVRILTKTRKKHRQYFHLRPTVWRPIDLSHSSSPRHHGGGVQTGEFPSYI
jgi:hypothetical protein